MRVMGKADTSSRKWTVGWRTTVKATWKVFFHDDDDDYGDDDDDDDDDDNGETNEYNEG